MVKLLNNQDWFRFVALFNQTWLNFYCDRGNIIAAKLLLYARI